MDNCKRLDFLKGAPAQIGHDTGRRKRQIVGSTSYIRHKIMFTPWEGGHRSPNGPKQRGGGQHYSCNGPKHHQVKIQNRNFDNAREQISENKSTNALRISDGEELLPLNTLILITSMDSLNQSTSQKDTQSI